MPATPGTSSSEHPVEDVHCPSLVVVSDSEVLQRRASILVAEELTNLLDLNATVVERSAKGSAKRCTSSSTPFASRPWTLRRTEATTWAETSSGPSSP